MLLIQLMQQCYALSDPAMEDALYEIESMRRFAGFELNEDAIPDEATILKFGRSETARAAISRRKSEVLGRQEGRHEKATF